MGPDAPTSDKTCSVITQYSISVSEPYSTHNKHHDDEVKTELDPEENITYNVIYKYCKVCDYNINNKLDFVNHSNIYINEKTYKCSLRTTDKSNLVRHMRTHSSKRPNSCTKNNKN